MITEGTEVSKSVKKRKATQTKRQGAETTKATPITVGKAGYAKLTPDNRKWVAQKAVETGHPSTTVVNQALEAVRTGKKFTLDTYEPKYLTRATEARNNRIARLKKIANA